MSAITVRRTLFATMFAGCAAFAAFVAYWAATGGRWFIVQTPSMGTSAPVGTLLWVKPVPAATLHVGEFISFRPPGSAMVYSHRIYRMFADGTIATKGQLSPPDPWRITAHDVIGQVAMRWWGVGWLVKAAPILILGALVLWFVVTRLVPRTWQLGVAVSAASLLVSICIVVYRPLTQAVQLSLTPEGGGGRASYVSTGLLPLQLRAGSDHVDLRAGQIGTVFSSHADQQGNYPISLHPDIPWWFWAVLVLACFVPAIWTTLSGVARRPATA